ncbi:MAG: lysoplasmalogenase family protein [Anaerolineae bacterium]
MFPLPYRYPFNLFLYALFVLEFVLLMMGLAFGKLNKERTGRLPRPLRMLLSALLVLAALLGWQGGAHGTPLQNYAILIFLGMAAGFVGDLIMAELIPVPNRLIFGMIEFSIGHLFYIAAFLNLLQSHFVAMRVNLIGLLIAILGFCVCAWYSYVRKPGGSKVMNVGSLVYGLLIGTMVTLAVVLAIGDAHFVPLALGAWLFLASDFILGNWVIRGHVWKSVNDVIWVAYVCGQLLIVYSVAAALHVWQ